MGTDATAPQTTKRQPLGLSRPANKYRVSHRVTPSATACSNDHNQNAARGDNRANGVNNHCRTGGFVPVVESGESTRSYSFAIEISGVAYGLRPSRSIW